MRSELIIEDEDGDLLKIREGNVVSKRVLVCIEPTSLFNSMGSEVMMYLEVDDLPRVISFLQEQLDRINRCNQCGKAWFYEDGERIIVNME